MCDCAASVSQFKLEFKAQVSAARWTSAQTCHTRHCDVGWHFYYCYCFSRRQPFFFDNRSSDAEQTSKAENCEHANISYLKRTTKKKIKTIRADINKFHIVDKSRSEKKFEATSTSRPKGKHALENLHIGWELTLNFKVSLRHAHATSTHCKSHLALLQTLMMNYYLLPTPITLAKTEAERAMKNVNFKFKIHTKQAPVSASVYELSHESSLHLNTANIAKMRKILHDYSQSSRGCVHLGVNM